MIPTNSPQAWLLAARPKTLSGAAVPVMIGTAMAWRDAGAAHFGWLPALLCLLFAFIMQIDSNFINDYFDCVRGNDDSATRLGPRRACAEGWVTLPAMRIGIMLTTLLGCVVGLPLVCYGGWQMVTVGLVCVAFAFLYTTKLSYVGLGDVLVVVFFGIVPVTMTYYVTMPEAQQAIGSHVFSASLACGLVIDTLLLVNNYRDRDNDRRDGKRTLVVRIGPKATEWLYLAAGLIGAHVLFIVYVKTGGWGWRTITACTLLCPYLTMHCRTLRTMRQIHQGSELNRVLGLTARNMLVFGLSAALGILIV